MQALSSITRYFDYNAATLSGCIDIIVVRHNDGSLRSTPFHVRIGKMKLLNSKDKEVKIYVNDKLVDLTMILGSEGAAYFTKEINENDTESIQLTSPSSSPFDSPISSPIMSDNEASNDPEPLSLEDYDDSPPSTKKNYAWAWGKLPKHQKVSPPSYTPIDSGSIIRVPVSSQVLVSSRDTYSIQVPSLSAGSFVSWSFSTENHDIKFSVNYIDYANNKKVLKESQRIDSHLQQQNGGIISPGEGYIELVWDNSYSIYRRKKLIFDVDCYYADNPLPMSVPINSKFGWGILELCRRDSICIVSLLYGRAYMKSDSFEIVGDINQLDGLEVASTVGSLVDDLETDRDSLNGLEVTSPRSKPDSSPVTPVHHSYQRQVQNPVALSLCRSLLTTDLSNDQKMIIFNQNKISNDCLSNINSVLSNPDLVCLVDGQFKTLQEALPQIIAYAAFNTSIQPPPTQVTQTSIFTPEKSTSQKKEESEIKEKKKKYVKTLKPSSEQLQLLNLKDGENSIKFEVSSRFQGTSSVTGSIYLYPPQTKIVITDVDGTITISDLLGHIMYMVGQDWSHNGVASLFSAIRKNGYVIMYLSARAIGMMNMTKNLITNISQGDDVRLPPGPVMTSPDRLFQALAREVWMKKPHEFKIAALEDIRMLFPKDENPFYAAFGNRDTDYTAYDHVGIDDRRIFLVNSKGKISQYQQSSINTTYSDMKELVDYIFPPINPNKPEVINPKFNSYNYWKPRLYFDDDDDDAELDDF